MADNLIFPIELTWTNKNAPHGEGIWGESEFGDNYLVILPSGAGRLLPAIRTVNEA